MKDMKEISAMLESGVQDVFNDESFKNYMNFVARFHKYSMNNTILIWLQNPQASLVAGFKKWKNDFERHVKKGEKGIQILAPVQHKIVQVVENDAGEKEEKEIRWTTYRPVSVFDISQTEGKDVPEWDVKPLDGSVEGFEKTFASLLAVSPVPVIVKEFTGDAHGYFSRTENRIVVQGGMSEAQTLKTTIHEIAHAILHGDDGSEKDAGRSDKEIQAESVAYIVCQFMGLDTSDYSFNYVAAWSREHKVEELQENLNAIQSTAREIIDKLQAA